MKSLIVRLSLLTAVLFCVAFVTPAIASAQDTKPIPENPPSESPRPEPPPSPPAESPRNDPPPSPPAESPRNDPPPSPPAEAPRSEPAPSAPNSGGGSSNNDGGSSRSNDNRRNDNESRRNNDGGGRNSDSNRTGNNNRPAGNNEGGGRVRGTMSGDGSGNRRDRVIETESGDVIVPNRTGAVNPNGNPNPGNTGGNPGGNSGNGNRGGNAGNRGNRDGWHRGGDRDRDRWRDRHRDGRGHRHYRGDECYQVPSYDDTVSYSAVNYPDYDRDDSLSAYELGYNDGLYTGANDGRRGQTYDPERSRFYKGTPGYHPTKGSRVDYEQAYRDGFLRGYREGYQNWQKYFVGGRFKR